ncbi:MAG: hypothetical protein HON53_02875 [Planctomycetaceae bacterium]|jgi:hypothetical protein|nr:hypothetical protein [Planctomycetaceae bacterium]MBT6153224.1 hypothetical protein [Planctomycetaceae bacterium]MBT6484582.1 hypothetical protein [Planctomycetaceae bacterium]MBT6495634.1 hypothetical protein [Planctomycetaceae bacterium]
MGSFAMVAAMIVGTILLMAVIFIRTRIREKKRTENLRAIAAELSFGFAEGDERLLAHLGEFPLFSKGSDRKMNNVLQGTSSDTEVSLFDYRYTTSNGKNSQIHRQTAVCFRSKRLDLPNFTLQPESWFHKIGTMLGYQDIDFADYPEFSRKYLLRGDDEESVRDLFTAATIEQLDGQTGICLEGRGNWLIVYRAGKRAKPMEVQDFLATGFDVYAAFAHESVT